jgi:putative transposase
MGYEPIINGRCYHIYNRGVNGRDLFPEPEYYEQFLYLYERYIHPVAETFAWALMRNHFHILVRIRENIAYKYDLKNLPADQKGNAINKWETTEASSDEHEIKKPDPGRHFAHLFNAYSKYHQNHFGRTGNLFERPFKRKWIDTATYFKQVIIYIHQNPVHHGFCSHPLEYPWSSYLTHTSNKATKISRNRVREMFGTIENFKKAHLEKINRKEIESWLEITNADYFVPVDIPDVHRKEVRNLQMDISLIASKGLDGDV